jgi:hypothetical protein
MQTLPGALSVANIQMLMWAVDQQLGVPLIFVFVRKAENLSENYFAEIKKEKISKTGAPYRVRRSFTISIEMG